MTNAVTNIINNSSILGGSNSSSAIGGTTSTSGPTATEGASSSTTGAIAGSGESTGSASMNIVDYYFKFAGSSTLKPGRRRIT